MNRIIILGALAALLICITGCCATGMKTSYYRTDGSLEKIEEPAIAYPGSQKAINGSLSATGFEAATTETTTGQISPLILFMKRYGCWQSTIAFKKDETCPRMIHITKDNTYFGQFLTLFGIDTGIVEISYTSPINESAEDSSKVITAAVEGAYKLTGKETSETTKAQIVKAVTDSASKVVSESK